MKKVKYIFSKESQRFEPIRLSLKTKLLRLFALLSAILVSASIIVAIAFRFLASPKEQKMRTELNVLQEKYDLLKNDLKHSERKLRDLQKRDNDIYRVIFEAEPLPEEITKGLDAMDEKDFEERLKPYDNALILKQMQHRIQILKKGMLAQEKSFDSIIKMIENKKELLSALPSIQPVSNKDLSRIASGFGFRIDPIYKIGKFHAGLDFTAPQGTPIYATGDGKVELSEYSSGGYGNEIWINHGYGYRTHYAHMVKRKSNVGEIVKRGETIGWVGSTGKSTGPHLHYEVERRGQKIDPIYFFFNDLGAQDYERMIKLSQAGNQSFD